MPESSVEMVKIEYTAPDGKVYALGSRRDDWQSWEKFAESTKHLFKSTIATMMKVHYE